MAKSKQKKSRTGTTKRSLPLGMAMPGRTIIDPTRMEVVDYVGWGNMIKGWSRKPATAPKDLEDLKEQCHQAGIGLTVPVEITTMRVIVQADNEFILRLPPAKSIQESEDALKQGGLYPIPTFYNDRYGAILNITSVDEQLKFHAQRIGDYVIRKTA